MRQILKLHQQQTQLEKKAAGAYRYMTAYISDHVFPCLYLLNSYWVLAFLKAQQPSK